jgi:hypothetical protein
MINRLFITLSLLFSLIAVNAVCLGIGVLGDVISESNDPAFPEEEESESVDETKFEKLRLSDLHTRTDEQGCSGCTVGQLTLAAPHQLGSLIQRVIFARGPPAV